YISSVSVSGNTCGTNSLIHSRLPYSLASQRRHACLFAGQAVRQLRPDHIAPSRAMSAALQGACSGTYWPRPFRFHSHKAADETPLHLNKRCPNVTGRMLGSTVSVCILMLWSKRGD